MKKPRGRPRKNLLSNSKNIPCQTKRKRGRPRKEIYKDKLPKINSQKGSRTKVESGSDSDPDYSDYLKQTQARSRRKKNAKKAKNINDLENEEIDNYFSTSEDEINDIETTHEGNYGENNEENLEENFEGILEEHYEEKFKENHEQNPKEIFDEPYFKAYLKLNRRNQINYEEDENDHKDDNRPPPEPPPPNSKSTRQILMNRKIVECRDQLTMRKNNHAYFVTTNGTPRDNGSKTLEKR